MLQVGLNNRWVMKPAWSAGLPPRRMSSGREEKNLSERYAGGGVNVTNLD
jgi:hypothetical protein